MFEAQFYEKLGNERIRCRLCAHQCTIKPKQRGICGVRENQNGQLSALTYERLLSAAIDPIEKKPLYHFLPGSQIFSICTAGCNFGCLFCQNADISQLSKPLGGQHNNPPLHGEPVEPARIVELARQNDCASIAYTYTEPTVFFEYALATAQLAGKQGIKNVFVTNGYISREPLKQIAPCLDAMNIDLKSFSDDFYQKLCKARLQPVLDTIQLAHSLGIWLELTTLVIPGHNDNPEELKELTAWIAGLDPSIPWHVSRFTPCYKMDDVPATPVASIYQAIEIGQQAGLKFIYAGNIAGDKYHDTLCPECQTELITRTGYFTLDKSQASMCPNCQTKLPGVFG